MLKCEHRKPNDEGYCASCTSYLFEKVRDLERGFIANTLKLERAEQVLCGVAFDLGRSVGAVPPELR